MPRPLLSRLLALGVVAFSGTLPAQDNDPAAILGDPRPAQPRFSFTLTELHPGLARKDGLWTVGHVRIFKRSAGKSKAVTPHQTIEVAMTDNESFFAQFGVERPDLNCDGFPDLQVSQFGGAKWGYAHVWLYHPATQSFVSTALTKKFATMSHANYRIDPKTTRLHLRQFYGAQLFEYTYHITPERFIFESKVLVKR